MRLRKRRNKGQSQSSKRLYSLSAMGQSFAYNDLEEENYRRLLFMKRLATAVLYRAIAEYKLGGKVGRLAYKFLVSKDAEYWCNKAGVKIESMRKKLQEIKKKSYKLVRKRSRYYKEGKDVM